MNENGHATQDQLHEDIQFSLSSDLDQAKRFAKQMECLEGLNEYFIIYPEDAAEGRYEERVKKVKRALDYRRPYRIAIVARTGVGKSTFANAVLGRDLLLARMGEPATGTVLEIYQTADSVENEKAEVFYRSEEDIRNLIQKEMIDRFKLEASLPEKLDEEFVKTIESAESTGEKFQSIQECIIDIINQYIRHGEELANTTQEYNLNDPELNDLINENSDLNQGENRRIGLVKRVAYYVCPKQDEKSTLQLPRNTCLIDLPGIDATPLHDIIIKEDVKEADTVVFMFEASRQKVESEEELMKDIRENIGINSSEQVFPVVNKQDQIRSSEDADQVSKTMDDIVQALSPTEVPKRSGDFPFFPVCASIARLASQKIDGHQLNDEDATTYENYCKQFGIDDAQPKSVLEETGIPEVVKALNQWAANSIEARIEETAMHLNETVAQLMAEHDESNFESIKSIEQELQDRTEIQIQKVISTQGTAMKLCVELFRKERLLNREELNKSLKGTVNKICDSIDKKLVADCPRLWESSLNLTSDRMTASSGFELSVRDFITNVNVKLCDLLSEELRDLAQEVAKDYSDTFEKDEVRENLLKLGSGLPGTADVFSQEKNARVMIELEASLEQFCTRVAIAIMLDPRYYLWKEVVKSESDSEYREENESHEDSTQSGGTVAKGQTDLEKAVQNAWKALKDADTSPGAKNLPDEIISPEQDSIVSQESSKEIVNVVREIYFPHIEKRVVTDLLNVYAYEMLVAEKSFFRSIEKLIASSRSRSAQVSLPTESEDVKILRNQIAEAQQRAEKREHLSRLSTLISNPGS